VKSTDSGLANTAESGPWQPAEPTVDEALSLPQSDRASKFEQRASLGEGGMGLVYEGYERVLRRNVAVKCIHPTLALDQVSRNRFIEEARVTAQLDHPSVVPVHELAVDEQGTPYFTMKVVRGVTFDRYLADPKRPIGSVERITDALEVILKLCDVLSFAHSKNVLHLDIKPENVMVGDFGEVYLMDWGLAPTAEQQAKARPDERLIIGTTTYMSPEQALADVLDQRADVFGLGALLYYVVCGFAPYDSYDGSQDPLIRAERRDFIPPHRVSGVRCPETLARIILKALAPREVRYQTITDLRAHVHRFIRGGFYLPRVVHPPGTRIIEEGAPGHEAYIIMAGRCAVYKGTGIERRFLCHLETGSVFGEIAVIADEFRSATVEAVDEVITLVLTRDIMNEWLSSGSWESILVRSLVKRFQALDRALWDRGDVVR
jgi:eukaryotic-like serine/threonine-protein kinase